MNNKPRSAPNFTNASIVMFGVNIAWVFVILWSIWGIIAVAIVAWCINTIISIVERRRS